MVSSANSLYLSLILDKSSFFLITSLGSIRVGKTGLIGNFSNKSYCTLWELLFNKSNGFNFGEFLFLSSFKILFSLNFGKYKL